MPILPWPDLQYTNGFSYVPDSLLDLIEYIFNGQVGMKERAIFACVAWLIYGARTDRIFQNTSILPTQLARKVPYFLTSNPQQHIMNSVQAPGKQSNLWHQSTQCISFMAAPLPLESSKQTLMLWWLVMHQVQQLLFGIIQVIYLELGINN